MMEGVMRISRIHRINALFIVCLFLTGCEDDVQRRVGRFELLMNIDNFAKSSDQSKSVWIVKHSWAGKIHMGTMFGFIDNLRSCAEFVEPYNKRYPEVHYTCEEI
jgi:hypothetical protein